MSTKINRLTASGVKGADAGLHHDGLGLYLQVKPPNTRSWLFRYRSPVTTKEVWMGLGGVSDFTLAEARDKARDCRQQLAKGIDPQMARDQEKARMRLDAAKAKSFRAVAEEYIQTHSPSWTNPKHRQQWENTLATHVWPICGDYPVQAIDTPTILRVLRPKWIELTETMSRVQQRMKAIIDFATASGYRVGENPARWSGLLSEVLPSKSFKDVRHHPALPYTQMPEFMAALEKQNGIAAVALKLLILTGTRTIAIIYARPDEFLLSEKTWLVPIARNQKTGKQLRIPLSDEAVAVVKDALKYSDGVWLFPGERRGKSLSNAAMLALMQRMRKGDGSKWTDHAGEQCVPHGMRSTLRDWISEQTSFANHVAEQALGHSIRDAVEEAYRRGDLLAKRAKLMSAWARYCYSPAKQQGSNVTSIKAATQ